MCSFEDFQSGNTSVVPSGDHAGVTKPPEFRFDGNLARIFSPVPSALARTTSISNFGGSPRRKAMRLPSGESAGAVSASLITCWSGLGSLGGGVDGGLGIQ